MPASLPMWKDSWEIIAAQPLPWLNKAPAVEQEVGSSTALRRQESSSLPERQWFGAGKSKLTLRQQSLQKAASVSRCVNINCQRDGGQLVKMENM